MRTLIYDSKTLPHDRWAALCAGDPHTSIFHSTDWSLLWENTRRDARAEWWVLTDDEGNWIGGLPLVRFARFGITRLYSQPLGAYGGWVGERFDGLAGRLTEWTRRLTRLTVAELVVTSFTTSDAIDYSGRKVKRERYVLDLSPSGAGDSWKSRLRRDVARNIKLAARHNWTIEEVRTVEDVERTRGLWKHTAARHNRRFDPSRWQFLKSLVGSLTAGEELFWWTASADDSPAATTIALRSGDRMFSFDGAMDVNRKDGHPMHALYEKAIDTAVGLGCRTFDFGSGPADARGLELFKQGWGAQPERYYEYHLTKRWWPKR